MENFLRAMAKDVGSNPDATDQQERHAAFLALIPRIRRLASYYLRQLSAEVRDEALQEIVVNSFVSYLRLVERGKADRVFAGPLAKFGALQYFRGRRIGSCRNGQDLLSEYGRRKNGISVERLDRFHSGDWQQLAVEDRRTTPAEVATTRVDFRAWLESLPERTRAVAETLATGEGTGCVARMFGISPSRVSQIRGELYSAWLAFTGETAVATSARRA